MTTYEKTVKFVRSHQATITAGVNGGTLYWMKLLYEFWGFCVNGTNDLLAPGGFATISGSNAPNYLRMAPRFESGSAVLIASGSDGVTAYGSQVFTAPSINWTSGTMAGRWLVTWKSASASTDDGIYPIMRVLNSSSIVVDTTAAGTPMSASKNELRFTGRSSVNFRVVDFAAAHNLSGYAVNDYMIMQFNGSAINAGQANSQAQIRLATGNGTITQGNISVSASGSWSGSAFSDLSPELTPDGSTPGDGGAGYATYDWFNGTNGTNYFSLWGDQGGVIAHSGGSLSTLPSYFHIEIPTRLFSAEKDPNPICFMNVGKQGVTTINFGPTQSEHFSAGWMIHNPFDNSTIRRYHALIRSIGGHAITNDELYTSDMGYVSTPRYQQAFYNTRTRKFVIQDVILAHRTTTTSFTMGRCQLRLAAMATGPYQAMTKLGSRGEWISIAQGVLWPWDNSQCPRTLFVAGA